MFFNESMSFSSENTPVTNTGLTGDAAGVYCALAEGNELWFNLREKMMKLEHTSIMKEKDGLISEAEALLESGVQDFFTKIANWFKWLWERIKEIFSKFVTTITSLVMTDQAFLKKYEKVILEKESVINSGFEAKMVDWKATNLTDKLTGGIKSAISKAEGFMGKVSQIKDSKSLEAYKEEIQDEKFKESIQDAILSGSGGSEFKDAIRKTFTNDGSLEKNNVTKWNVKGMISCVKNKENNIKEAQTARDNVEQLLGKAQKFYSNLSKELGKFDGDLYASQAKRFANDEYSANMGSVMGTKDTVSFKKTAASLSATGVKTISGICSTVFAEILSAIKARRSDFRSALNKMVTYKAKESVNSSYDFMQESGSILDRF